MTGGLNDLVQQESAQDTNKSFKLGAAKTQGTHFNRSRHFYISNESTIESGTMTTPFRCRFIACWNDPRSSNPSSSRNLMVVRAMLKWLSRPSSIPSPCRPLHTNNRVFLWLLSKTLQYKYQIPQLHSDYLPWCSDSLVSAIVLTSKDSLSISLGHSVRM